MRSAHLSVPKFNGGTYLHDQLRMARYSLQQSYHARHWYKSMFLCLLDMTLANTYISWHLLHRNSAHGRRTRSQFYYILTEGMLQTIPFEGGRVTRRCTIPGRARAPSGADEIVGDFSGHFIKQMEPKRARQTRT